jgi:hypothetical protein
MWEAHNYAYVTERFTHSRTNVRTVLILRDCYRGSSLKFNTANKTARLSTQYSGSSLPLIRTTVPSLSSVCQLFKSCVFLYQSSVVVPCVTHPTYTPSPYSPSLFHWADTTRWGAEVLSIILSLPIYFVLLRFELFSGHSVFPCY